MIENADLQELVGNKYPFEIRNGLDQASWYLDGNLKPVVLLPSNFVKNAFERLPKEEIQKLFFDPFFGIFPHEINEANLAVALARGNTSILTKYPSYKPHGKILERLIAMRATDAEILASFGKDRVGPLEWIAGEAHHIITASDFSGYHTYTDRTEDQLRESLCEVEFVPTIGKNTEVMNLITRGSVICSEDGFDIGEMTVDSQTIYYVEDKAYAVIQNNDGWYWLLEMYSLSPKSGAIRSIIKYVIKKYKQISLDIQLSAEAIAYFEKSIAAGHFNAYVVDYKNRTMTSYNPDDENHRKIPIYDCPYGERPANTDSNQYGWVLREGIVRRGILSPNTILF